MAKPTPASILRAELEHKRRTLPLFLKPQLGELLECIDQWVLAVDTKLDHYDARLRAIEKMPSAAALEQLTA